MELQAYLRKLELGQKVLDIRGSIDRQTEVISIYKSYWEKSNVRQKSIGIGTVQGCPTG